MTVAHAAPIILIPILGIFLFFQQLLMEKQEEAFPLLPNTLSEGRMSAIKLDSEALAAHAASCDAAETELLRLRDEEQRRSQAVNSSRDPRVWLDGVLLNAGDAFRKTLRLPRDAWRVEKVCEIVTYLCSKDARIAWSGDTLPTNQRPNTTFWMQASIDGMHMLVRFRPEQLHSIIGEQFLGLLIWYSSKLALEQVIAAAYDLTQRQVQCLVTGNRRARLLFQTIVITIAKNNYGAWWDEHDAVVRRTCDRLHELPPDATPSYGVSLPEPFTDLPLYCPTGNHAGERIDLLSVIGNHPDLFTTIVAELGDNVRSPAALDAFYNLGSTHADPAPTAAPSPPS